MRTALGRLGAAVRLVRPGPPPDDPACSWDAMRATYEAQAARGVPEAIRGLERIEQGRWPSTGRRRDR